MTTILALWIAKGFHCIVKRMRRVAMLLTDMFELK